MRLNHEKKLKCFLVFIIVGTFNFSSYEYSRDTHGWVFINKAGEIVFNGIYLRGRVVIDPVFDEAWDFEYDGRAAVKSKGRWKYIDTKGSVIGYID